MIDLFGSAAAFPHLLQGFRAEHILQKIEHRGGRIVPGIHHGVHQHLEDLFFACAALPVKKLVQAPEAQLLCAPAAGLVIDHPHACGRPVHPVDLTAQLDSHSIPPDGHGDAVTHLLLHAQYGQGRQLPVIVQDFLHIVHHHRADDPVQGRNGYLLAAIPPGEHIPHGDVHRLLQVPFLHLFQHLRSDHPTRRHT